MYWILSVAIRLCGLSALMLVASGCATTSKAGSADSFCLVVADPSVTPEWVDAADQAWVDWLAPIVDYSSRECEWH